MSATKYYRNPFGIAGDVSPVPDDTQPSGTVSYEQGFPLGYELPQTDPAYLDVPRAQTNQIYLDITSNIQQYQQVGSPNFITTVQNGGTPYPYGIYAVVVYDDGVNGPRKFMSKKNTNTSLPTVKADWLLIDNTASAVAIDNAALDGAVVTGNAVYYDSVSSTFKQALANGAAPQKIIGFAHTGTGRVFTNGLASFMTGLTPGSTYYLSTTTAGTLTTIMPTTNAVSVGVAKSATELMINIQTDSFNPADLFTSSIILNGYEKNNETGKITQWGSGTLPASGINSSSVPITFPIPFPNNVFNIVTCYAGIPSAGNVISTTFTGQSVTGFLLSGFSNGTFIGTIPVSWQAIGN